MKPLVHLTFTLNGTPVEDQVPGDKSLLWYLRERRGLTGAKSGCGKGHCGACTVLLNGDPVRSCVIPLSSPRLQKAIVETIESLSPPGGPLHPLQQAFVDNGAIQCGFCTPAMIMSAKALLQENPSPGEEEIKAHFARHRNFCRCTGYKKIVDAVKDAAARISGGEAPLAGGSEDMSVRRAEAGEKARGALKYGNDLVRQSMLYGRILWSGREHALLRELDCKEAEAHPGVRAVVTYRDIRGTNRIGCIERDQPALLAVGDKTRFPGDPVACVFAESEEAAGAALEKIIMVFEDLVPVRTVEEARRPGAPLVHEEKKGNLFRHVRLERGDVDEAFSRCDAVIEERFFTPRIEHAYLEPEAGLAYPDGTGGLLIEIATQDAFSNRAELSEALAIPEEKIRIIQIPVGGAFGAKGELVLQACLALGALKCSAPVKISLSREESIMVHVKRHPVAMQYRLGADREGKLLALDASLEIDKGAYASCGLEIIQNMAIFAAGPYFIPSVRIDGKSWYTNAVPSGAMRGFGANQVTFAMESMVDLMARKLSLDPIEIRIRNALRPGLPNAADQVIEPGMLGVVETLEALRDVLRETPPPRPGKGRKLGLGIACGYKNMGFGHHVPESAAADVELSPGGDLTVRISHHELGQGALMGTLTIASSALGIPKERISVITADTAETPYTGSTSASRQTVMTGNAVMTACRSLLSSVRQAAAGRLGIAEPAALFLDGPLLRTADSRRSIALGDLGCPLAASFRYFPPETVAFPPPGEKSAWGTPGFRSRKAHWGFSAGAHAAWVEVDEERGDIKVLKVIACHDVGKVLNRRAVEAQIEGGVMMGIGYALTEEWPLVEGRALNDTFLKCGVPDASMAPEIVSVAVEVPFPEGPYGMKGFAEVTCVPITPAVINAIHDATGCRVKDLPAGTKWAELHPSVPPGKRKLNGKPR
ncbi:MAG: molybdopterin-dependent oxidoreductase [Candidatus Eremiobacteraeota bacterium]|nr:molybdopterin-dependent oxidoreductase [Candidatus Eremiobacteraeota bacterium]